MSVTYRLQVTRDELIILRDALEALSPDDIWGANAADKLADKVEGALSEANESEG
jgi:hypothetical protein